MENSIVDIDEALRGENNTYHMDETFDDITKIVQQWKQTELNGVRPKDHVFVHPLSSAPSTDDKYLNTRTFTRPKKRFTPNQPTPAALADRQAVNLRIGGLVTSMNRSFLGDVSPPSSMDSPSLSTAFCPVDDMLADTSTPGFDSFLKEVCSEHVADVVEHLDMTFPIVDLLPEPTGEHFDQTFPIVDLPELSDMELLNGTYDLDKEASEVRLSFSGFEPNVANQCLVYQSTPMKSALDQTHPVAPDVPTVKQPGLNTTIVVDNCDNPPPFDHSKYQTYVRTKQKPAVVSQNQQWTNECVGQSADDRQSLTNFEEFEKSMSMCQNETDFELMLNNISTSGGRMTGGDSMRKSLDHIKKRHSLMNLEKQLEDQRRSVASAATVDANRTTTASQKPTAMDGSFGSTLSSSGSGERLLRRSRVCDELADDLSSGIAPPCQLITKTTTTTIDITNPTTVDPSAHIPAETVTANPTLPVPRAGIPTRDRDRFKTIRISKHAPAEQPAGMHIPCATAADVHPMPTDVIQPPVPQTDNRTLVEGLAPRRELLRPPSQLKAIARRDASLGVTRKLSALPSVIRDGSAAAVTKAKSIHNLATGYERSVEKSAEEINAGNQKEVRQTNQFRIPLPAQRIGKLSGLIRPSSGYFSYNVRRNDSDTESGRMSPTNSLSSGSSKGSVYNPEAPTQSNKSAQNPVAISAPASQQHSNQTAAAPKVVKRSGIQPPSAPIRTLKRSGLPRPMSSFNR